MSQQQQNHRLGTDSSQSWRADDGPLSVVLGYSPPHQLKKVYRAGPPLTWSGSAHVLPALTSPVRLLQNMKRH